MSFPRCVVAMTTDEERSIDIMQPNAQKTELDGIKCLYRRAVGNLRSR